MSSSVFLLRVAAFQDQLTTTAGRKARWSAGQGFWPTSCPTACATVAIVARVKRSVSLPGDLAEAIEAAARAQGTTVSAWLTESAAHRLRIEAGRAAIAEWEAEHGPLSDEERAEGRARAKALLGRSGGARRTG